MKTHTSWIVVVRCNLDDVIAGAYPTVRLARQRMKAVLSGKGMPDAGSAKGRMVAWDDSGLIGVAIYRVRGDEVHHWEQHSFDESKEAA